MLFITSLACMQCITVERLHLMLCIEGYIMPVEWHDITSVLFKGLQYLQRDLLQELNPLSLVEVPKVLEVDG